MRQFSVGNQLNAVFCQQFTGLRHGKYAKFQLPRLSQASSCCSELRIVIARMANELPRSVGDALGDRLKQSFIQRSGDLNAERAIRSCESLLSDSAAKLSRKAAQHADLCPTRPEIRSCQKLTRTKRKSRAKGISYRADATIARRPEQRPQDSRKNVRVLVRIHVRNADARRLNLLYLRFCLSFNFTRIHTPREGTGGERFESIPEALRIGERRELGSIQHGVTVDQHNMAADTQVR